MLLALAHVPGLLRPAVAQALPESAEGKFILMHPQALVVGISGVGKKALTARLLGRPAAQLSQAEEWLIDTKYYTAQASVVLKPPSAAEGEDWQVLAHRTQMCAFTQEAACLSSVHIIKE